MNTTAPTWQTVFNRLGEIINRLTDDTTNYGGCCVVAALVGQTLQAQGIPARVVVHGGWGRNIDEIRQENNGRITPIAWWATSTFPHGEVVFVKDGKEWIYDTDHGVREFARYERAKMRDGALTVEEATELAGDPEEWNDWFPRSKIPAIERVVRRTLKPERLENV